MAYTDPITVSPGDTGHAADWNTYIRDNFRSSMHLLAYKSADESVPSSTVLQDDNHLFFAMAANDVWYVNVGIFWIDSTGTGAADLKTGFTIPGGGTNVLGLYTVAGDAAGTLVYFDYRDSGQARIIGAPVGQTFLTIAGVVRNGGTAGNFQFQWAQGTSNATAVTVKKDSLITGFKLA
jgi:hypothetical protein